METPSVMSSGTHLGIKGPSGRVPVLIFEQKLVHDEHSQGNEVLLRHPSRR